MTEHEDALELARRITASSKVYCTWLDLPRLDDDTGISGDQIQALARALLAREAQTWQVDQLKRTLRQAWAALLAPHDCEAWRSEGVGCKECNPLAQGVQDGLRLDEQEPPA